jgi:hypothetical protein
LPVAEAADVVAGAWLVGMVVERNEAVTVVVSA